MLPPAVAKMFNVKRKSGLLVERVLSGSLADKAGLKGGQAKIKLLSQNLWIGGDIILEIQNTVCETSHDFCTIRDTINTMKPGDEVSMKVLRGGETVELMIKL